MRNVVVVVNASRLKMLLISSIKNKLSVMSEEKLPIILLSDDFINHVHLTKASAHALRPIFASRVWRLSRKCLWLPRALVVTQGGVLLIFDGDNGAVTHSLALCGIDDDDQGLDPVECSQLSFVVEKEALNCRHCVRVRAKASSRGRVDVVLRFDTKKQQMALMFLSCVRFFGRRNSQAFEFEVHDGSLEAVVTEEWKHHPPVKHSAPRLDIQTVSEERIQRGLTEIPSSSPTPRALGESKKDNLPAVARLIIDEDALAEALIRRQLSIPIREQEREIVPKVYVARVRQCITRLRALQASNEVKLAQLTHLETVLEQMSSSVCAAHKFYDRCVAVLNQQRTLKRECCEQLRDEVETTTDELLQPVPQFDGDAFRSEYLGLLRSRDMLLAESDLQFRDKQALLEELDRPLKHDAVREKAVAESQELIQECKVAQEKLQHLQHQAATTIQVVTTSQFERCRRVVVAQEEEIRTLTEKLKRMQSVFVLSSELTTDVPEPRFDNDRLAVGLSEDQRKRRMKMDI